MQGGRGVSDRWLARVSGWRPPIAMLGVVIALGLSLAAGEVDPGRSGEAGQLQFGPRCQAADPRSGRPRRIPSRGRPRRHLGERAVERSRANPRGTGPGQPDRSGHRGQRRLHPAPDPGAGRGQHAGLGARTDGKHRRDQPLRRARPGSRDPSGQRSTGSSTTALRPRWPRSTTRTPTSPSSSSPAAHSSIPSPSCSAPPSHPTGPLCWRPSTRRRRTRRASRRRSTPRARIGLTPA